MDRLGFHAVHGEPQDVPSSLREFLGAFDHVLSFLGSPEESVSKCLGDIVGRRRLTCIDPRPTLRTLQWGTHIVEQWRQKWHSATSFLENDWHKPANSSERPHGGLLVEANTTGHETNAEVPQEPTYSLSSSAKPASSADKSCLGDRRIVLLHPGSGGLAKCLPLEVLEQVASAISVCGNSFHWMIGPDEIARFGEGFADRLRKTAPLVLVAHPDKAADAIRGASAYIGMDAGMTHVAALLGVPTLALFGPTDSRVWRPLGPSVRCVRFPQEAESLASWMEKLSAELQAMQLT
ncbi:MAG: hypothetical protein IT449_03515 [Phycisphaerales bacterium]|nr:hypothetical protein [Phycisphaerales bacterium]